MTIHSQAERARRDRAFASWERLAKHTDNGGGDFTTLIYTEDKYARNARQIGDPRNLPFLKDILAFAMSAAWEGTIICFTNSDIHLHPELPSALRLHCGIWGACTAHRAEFRNSIPDPKQSPEAWSEAGGRHMGRDLFAATREWLVSNWEDIPDAIIGAPMYDLHLAALVRHRVGHPTTRKNLEERVVPAELPLGYIGHEYHDPTWSKLSPNTPSHLHNTYLFRNWTLKHQPTLVWQKNNMI